MNDISSKLNEIKLLNRKLRNSLSFKGGASKIKNFKELLEANKTYIFYIYFVVFFTVFFLCMYSMPNKNTFKGGSNMNNDFNNIIQIINEQFLKLLQNLNVVIEPFNNLMKMQFSNIKSLIDNTNEAILKITRQYGETVDDINESLQEIYDNIYDVLYVCTPIPIIGGCSPIPFVPLIILLLIITYISCIFILDSKIYLPCYGCEEGNDFYNCSPGTGKGSIGCNIYTEFLNKIKLIFKQIKNIKAFVGTVKKAIKEALHSIFYLVTNISLWFYEAFGAPIEKVFKSLNFLKHIKLKKDYGFNFGEFLICPNFNTKGKDCIYYKNNKLRNSHGNNPVFQAFWKMIRVVLEVPPNVPKFPFKGGTDLTLKLNPIKINKVTQPKIESHTINTTTTTSSSKPPFDKDIIYKNLLETLIKIKIDPVKWLVVLHNAIVDAINLVIFQFVNTLKIITSFIFSLITEITKAITGTLGKIVNKILKPINEVTELALKLPKQLFKSISKLFDIGFFTLITYSFYNSILSIFPFLKDLQSFIFVMAIVALIQTILIQCPLIGGYYALYIPFNYVKSIFGFLKDNLIDYNKLFNTVNTYIIENNSVLKEIKEYIESMKTMYQIVLIIIIVILIIFIILNSFFNINQKIMRFIKSIVYGHYHNKFKIVKNKFMKYKLNKLIQKDKENKKNSNISFVDKIYEQKINEYKKYL